MQRKKIISIGQLAQTLIVSKIFCKFYPLVRDFEYFQDLLRGPYKFINYMLYNYLFLYFTFSLHFAALFKIFIMTQSLYIFFVSICVINNICLINFIKKFLSNVFRYISLADSQTKRQELINKEKKTSVPSVFNYENCLKKNCTKKKALGNCS